MTDAEKFVREKWPHATCYQANLYWPGQGHRRKWIVLKASICSVSIGQGDTEIEAWADAANRIVGQEIK